MALKTGAPTRMVTILAVDTEKNLAHAVDQYGASIPLRTDIRPWKSRGPMVGEHWIICDQYGEWTFESIIGSTDEDIDTSRIRGRNVDSGAPTAGQVLAWDDVDQEWEPAHHGWIDYAPVNDVRIPAHNNAITIDPYVIASGTVLTLESGACLQVGVR